MQISLAKSCRILVPRAVICFGLHNKRPWTQAKSLWAIAHKSDPFAYKTEISVLEPVSC
jgi:hypothetical protein